nr:hypothetical protein [Tanacetum cinerariifolium]
MAGTKEMWEAIKSKFDGNVESKKMQKYLLKQQFEGFSVSASEGLHKGYDRFQTLQSQLEIHGDGVSHEDANQKFLRSLPSSWSQVALIMRTKSRLDTPSFDDLYNNLRLFERDVKGTTASSSSNTQNVAFVSAENTSSTNDVSTAYSVSSLSVSKSQKEGSPSYTDEIIHSFFANQSSAPQLDCDDLEQINDDDLEEMDLKCRRRDGGYNGHKARDNSKRPAYQDDSKALVTIDGEAIDWSRHVEEDTQNFAMMAYSSSNSGSDNEENILRDYYCWLKTYCYSCKLKLLDDAADIKLRLLEQSAAAEPSFSIHKNMFSVSMESLSPQVVSAAKLPILNPNEFESWKMRIEHYFLMTDYSLWEVILNGDSPILTRVIEGVVQPVAPTTAEQRLARKNKLKAREKRFGRNKETKKRNKTDLEDQSLDDLFNSLKIYEAEVKSSSSTSTSTQNIAFMSSHNTANTNESVSVVASVSAASAKVPISALPNV